MTKAFSVTDVRLAFECPRLFYLGKHFGGMTTFMPPEASFGIGQSFHRLSDRFIRLAKRDLRFQELFAKPAPDLQVDQVAQDLQTYFYQSVFFPHLEQVTAKQPQKALSLHRLWQSLSSLFERWALLLIHNRKHCEPQDLAERTFIAQELVVKHNFLLPNGSHQQVRGRLDSLIYDFDQHRLCVVEYKTYQATDASAQLAQVALYSYMLQESCGVSINSAVYSFFPDLNEHVYTWEQLNAVIHQLIPLKLQQMQHWITWKPGAVEDPPPLTAQPESLCPICPKRKKCQTHFGTSPEISAPTILSPPPQETSPPPVTETPPAIRPQDPKAISTDQQPDPDPVGSRLITVLGAFGIQTESVGEAVGPAFVRVKVKPHIGVKVSSILRLSHDLQVQLDLKQPPLIAPQAGFVSIDLPRQDRQTAHFRDHIDLNSASSSPIKAAIGVDLNAQLIEADLSDPNTCHLLVGGTTGSGKSEFLKAMLVSLIARHSPEELKIVLVDPKRVTFPDFETLPWLYRPVIKDTDAAISLMEELVQEMESRYRLFEINRCHDLPSYQHKQDLAHSDTPPLPRIVCIFDEYADFMAEKEVRSALELSIKRLGAMARAAGIHLVIATQRPEAQVVTPLIRSNLPGRVALKTASESDSAIILGSKEGSAAYLLGKGDLLYQGGGSLLRLQSLLISPTDVPTAQLH